MVQHVDHHHGVADELDADGLVVGVADGIDLGLGGDGGREGVELVLPAEDGAFGGGGFLGGYC